MKKYLLGMVVMSALNGAGVYAENEKGNGGTIQYCPSATDPNKMYELYDLFEGRVVSPSHRDTSLAEPTDTKEAIITKAIKRIEQKDPILAAAVNDALKYYNRIVRYEPELKLDLTLDAHRVGTGIDCVLMPLVNWNEQKRSIFRNDILYQNMTALNQAATDLHEAVYRVARVSQKVKDSDQVRDFISQLLSSEELALNELIFPNVRRRIEYQDAYSQYVWTEDSLHGGVSTLATYNRFTGDKWGAGGEWDNSYRISYGCDGSDFAMRANLNSANKKPVTVSFRSNGKTTILFLSQAGENTEWVKIPQGPTFSADYEGKGSFGKVTFETRLCGKIVTTSPHIWNTKLYLPIKVEME